MLWSSPVDSLGTLQKLDQRKSRFRIKKEYVMTRSGVGLCLLVRHVKVLLEKNKNVYREKLTVRVVRRHY